MKFTHAFAEPGRENLIDVINPDTGLSSINGETLEQVRERYPGAELVNLDDWTKAKAARQDSPITWSATTKSQYWYALEVLPPAFMDGSFFLVGEPVDHHMLSGAPRFRAYGQIGKRYIEASRPLTISELREQMKSGAVYRSK